MVAASLVFFLRQLRGVLAGPSESGRAVSLPFKAITPRFLPVAEHSFVAAVRFLAAGAVAGVAERVDWTDLASAAWCKGIAGESVRWSEFSSPQLFSW